ncbi:MAG: glutamine amidotransferase [Gammaproteobacteria bacterium]
MKKIVIVKTGQTVASLSAAGEDFEDWIIAGSGLTAQRFEIVPVFAGAPLPEPGACEALIVTGSPAMVTDREPWSESAAAFLQRAHEQHIPILGICYGHQLLAHGLGGRVGYHPLGREIGTVSLALTESAPGDPLFQGLPGRFPAQVSHSQTVLQLPPGAELLASNDFEPHHAFRVGATSWGVQFHPEFSERVVKVYINERRSQLLAEHLHPDALLQTVRPTPESASLLKRFADLVEDLASH